MNRQKRNKLGNFIYQRLRMSTTDWLVDLVIALGAFGFGLLQLTISANVIVPDDFIRRVLGIRSVTPSGMAVIATALTCLPLILRRRFPWPAYLASIISWIWMEWALMLPSLSLVGPLIALFTLAYERDRIEAFVAGGSMLLIVLFIPLSPFSTTLTNLLMMQNAVLVIAVDISGYALHVRQEYVRAAEARADREARLRVSETRRAIEEERVRIAREVHDITAHSISAVSIQASVAERLVDVDPAAAKASIATIKETSRDALNEMRAMIDVLRTPSKGASFENAETTPVQGTDQLPALKAYLESAGIECRLETTEYDRARLHTYVDVALFSIAREATTNIVRHSGAEHALISLETDRDFATLQVEDDGRGLDVVPVSIGDRIPGGGHGIEGMRERALALGGNFSIMNNDTGGTTILVQIPISS